MNNEGDVVMIITAPCRNCDRKMLSVLVGDGGGNMGYGPEGFNASEIALAERNGVLLKKVNSKTAEENYLASVCGDCGAFVGQWFYFANYYIEAFLM